MRIITIDCEEPTTAPALAAERVEPNRWNGWAVPVATRAALAAFITEWAHVDPNGIWRPAGVVEEGSTLTYDDGEHDDPDVWQAVGVDSTGAALYALDGWCWIEADR
ncbi:hypothetical protein [Occultella kanbiaonis]|uniref:hypothetical protein n=1 Tax=Occultella kanbiaonis TaxID=2675754 RepID=UPI0012B8766B|nr:hypothetical protein [Occultella kanbiaonis]